MANILLQVLKNYDNYNINYTNIDGDWGGNGNISTDPLFTDPNNGDFTLQSTSPCIDAGDPNSDRDPDGTRADIGAKFFNQNHPPEIRSYWPEDPDTIQGDQEQAFGVEAVDHVVRLPSLKFLLLSGFLPL